MDELNDLKSAWNTIVQSRSGKAYSAEELKLIVKKRSNNELNKIRRKILTEWAFAIVLASFLVLFIWFIKPADTKYAFILMGVILAVSFFPYINILRLKLANHTNLKSYLHEFLTRFDLLVKQYIRMATILIPIAGLGGFLLGFHSSTGQEEWLGFFTAANLLITIVCVGVVSFGGYWIQNRYFKWIYGNNIQRLQDCLTDLEHVEEMEF